VVYQYSARRDANLVHDQFMNFKGVLVSDFYAAYDAMNCPQQKCLIHLIRDLNSGLLDNPYDEELKHMVKQFGELIGICFSELLRR